MDYSQFGNKFYSDWEAGREDASQTNPYRHDAGRTGEALAAYDSGWKYGEECMCEYYDEQE